MRSMTEFALSSLLFASVHFSLGGGDQESQELHVGGDLRRVPLEFDFLDFVPAGFCGSHELGFLWKGSVPSSSIELMQLFVKSDKLLDCSTEVAVIKVRAFLDIGKLVVQNFELPRDKYKGG